MQVLPLYINQFIDLHSKSIDWFIYEGNFDIYWVKLTSRFQSEKFLSEDLSYKLSQNQWSDHDLKISDIIQPNP